MDRITLVGYPITPTDASIKITELHANDSGVYRCEVMQGIEDSHDIVDVQVQGTVCEKILKNMLLYGYVCVLFYQRSEIGVHIFF